MLLMIAQFPGKKKDKLSEAALPSVSVIFTEQNKTLIILLKTITIQDNNRKIEAKIFTKTGI